MGVPPGAPGGPPMSQTMSPTGAMITIGGGGGGGGGAGTGNAGTGGNSGTGGGGGGHQQQKESNLEGLEFDGDTVLCRVCGDKASGFHYGVHACEGCKGFFRRSIQQKIQYRPCLKNQQCNIMRVNRNRCQYCRLKKCIAVGMSRDAVRFGRVPKKEKAKIMEQMHKVNSQSQVTLLNTVLESGNDVTHKIVDAHVRTCDFTQAKLRAFLDKAWQSPQFVNCPAHMACPLNPSPETSDGTKKWDEFSECFTPAIRNVVNFAKCIPGFQILSQEDQVTLLKAGTFEVLLVHLACLFDAQTNTMCFANGKLYKRVSLTVTNSAGFLLDSMFDFAERLNTMQLSDEEIALFSAIVIIAADRPGLRNVEQVERVQNRITQALQALMSSKHPDDPALFAKLLMKIPDLRTLNTLHSEKLLGLTVPAGSGKNGGSVEKPRTSVEGQSPYYPGGLMPGGFPMFGGPMVPGGLRDSAMQYPVHPPDVPAIIPHQMSLDSAHQNHSVVLQTPLGTFHRYNSALQQHLSMNRPIDFPQRPGECPVSSLRDREDDLKSNDINAMPKFKTEEAVRGAIQNQVKEQQRVLREEMRDAHTRGEVRTPVNTHERLTDPSSSSSDPKTEGAPHHLPSWPSLHHNHPQDRLHDQPPEYGEQQQHSDAADRVTHKRRSHEEDEVGGVTRKAQKFWGESGGRSGCPVSSGGYNHRLSAAAAAASLQHSVPAPTLPNPGLMSLYQKESLLHFHHHHHHQQQQYEQKKVHKNHMSTTEQQQQQQQFVAEDRLEEHGGYSDVNRRAATPESHYERSKQHEKDYHNDTNTHLPELKSALSRPPLLTPEWGSENRVSESESGGENVSKTSEDHRGLHNHLLLHQQNPANFDQFFVHKKLKMKRRGSSETVSSEGSIQETHQQGESQSPIPSGRLYPQQQQHQTSTSNIKAENNGGQESQRKSSDKDNRLHDQGCRRQDANANDIGLISVDRPSSIPHEGLTSRPTHHHPDLPPPNHHRPSQSQYNPQPSTHKDDQHQQHHHGSPTISLLDEETSEKSHHRSPLYNMKYINDSSNKDGNGNLRQNPRLPYDNKYYNGDLINPHLEDPKTIPKSSGSGIPPRLQNGMCGSSPFPPPSGVTPHPAYLPLPFPPMHPALMYQYNMAAAHQMAQYQQLQLAQAQMAMHHQVAMSKADSSHTSHQTAPPHGKDDHIQASGPKTTDDEQIKETSPSDNSRERHPLNLSKPQDTLPTSQKPVFVKPEPM